MTRTVLLVGAGRVGAALASLLDDAHHRITLIESDEQRARHVQDALPSAVLVVGDGTDPSVLEAAGIRTADVVAAITDDDAHNLVVCALARHEFAVARTLARIVDPAHGWLFDEATGVDVALDQADLLSRLIAEELSLDQVTTLVKLRRGDLTLVEERLGPDAAAVGTTVADLRLPEQCVLVAVIRGDDVLLTSPDLRLRAGDEILAIVHQDAAGDLARALARAT
jgi:trk system potassium uptake protein